MTVPPSSSSASPDSSASSAEPSGRGTGHPVIIPPPGTVRTAALLVALQACGLVVLAGMTLFSGLGHDAEPTQLFAQTAYFVVLAAALAAVAAGLLGGRRWSRSPAIVAQAVVVAVGMWMAFPSGQLRWGLVVVAIGGSALALLVTPRANHWIKQFPTPFGLGHADRDG